MLIFQPKPNWKITAINQIFKHFWHSWRSLAPSFRGIPSRKVMFPVSSLINSRALTFRANFNQRRRRRSISSTINLTTNSLHYQFSSAFPIKLVSLSDEAQVQLDGVTETNLMKSDSERRRSKNFLNVFHVARHWKFTDFSFLSRAKRENRRKWATRSEHCAMFVIVFRPFKCVMWAARSPHEPEHLGSFHGERFFCSHFSGALQSQTLRRCWWELPDWQGFCRLGSFRQFANTRSTVCNHRSVYFQLRNLIFTIHCATHPYEFNEKSV